MPDLNDLLFKEQEVTIRKKTWKVRELSVAQYDKCVDLARKPDGETDGRLLMRFLIAESLVDPKLSVEDIAKMPSPVYGALATAINEIIAADEGYDTKES